MNILKALCNCMMNRKSTASADQLHECKVHKPYLMNSVQQKWILFFLSLLDHPVSCNNNNNNNVNTCTLILSHTQEFCIFAFTSAVIIIYIYLCTTVEQVVEVRETNQESIESLGAGVWGDAPQDVTLCYHLVFRSFKLDQKCMQVS